MGVNIGRRRIGQEPLDGGFEVAPIREVGVDHEARGVEGAQREHPEPEALRRLVPPSIGPLRPFADEDGVARPIGRVRRLVEVVQEQNFLSRLGVAQLDAIGKARLRVGERQRFTPSLASSSSGSP